MGKVSECKLKGVKNEEQEEEEGLNGADGEYKARATFRSWGSLFSVLLTSPPENLLLRVQLVNFLHVSGSEIVCPGIFLFSKDT